MQHLIDFFNERAAIMEFDAGVNRGLAEQRARIELRKLLDEQGNKDAAAIAGEIWKTNRR